jgi:integrase/recombinase XerD
MSEIPQPRDDADPPAIGAAGLERPGWVSLLPRAAADPLATAFLRHLEVRGLSRNTLLAYGRALESLIELVGPLDELRLDANCVHRFLSHLRQTPSRQPSAGGRRLSHSTMRQRVVGLRAYADYLVDCGHLDRNPVTRGRIRRTPEGEVIAVRRGLVPSAYRVPRLPTDEQWSRLLNSLHSRPVRDRLMFTLAYDGALRRNELVTLRLDDFDFAAQQVTIRAEHAKSGYQRTIVYSAPTCDLLRLYLPERRKLFPETHFLFLSGSPRNRSKPLGGYTWGLLAAALAREADVPGFSTHTLRHLRLTDLARAGLGITEIAKFAGHRSTETTMTYIHLSGRDLARAFDRVSRVMAERFGRL